MRMGRCAANIQKYHCCKIGPSANPAHNTEKKIYWYAKLIAAFVRQNNKSKLNINIILFKWKNLLIAFTGAQT
jgi:hypothetical protein